MARPSNKAERRQQIVAGLLTVMSEKGYDGASIQAIAKAADLTPGLIHYHFKNKQEILLALVEQITTVANKRLLHFSKNATTPAEHLKAFIDSRLALGEGADVDTVRAWVLIGAEAVRQPEVREIYNSEMTEKKNVLTKLLANVATKKRSNNHFELLAGILLATMEGAFQLSVTSSEIVPHGTTAKAVMNIIERDVH